MVHLTGNNSLDVFFSSHELQSRQRIHIQTLLQLRSWYQATPLFAWCLQELNMVTLWNFVQNVWILCLKYLPDSTLSGSRKVDICLHWCFCFFSIVLVYGCFFIIALKEGHTWMLFDFTLGKIRWLRKHILISTCNRFCFFFRFKWLHLY
jgi:hypothetical protein